MESEKISLLPIFLVNSRDSWQQDAIRYLEPQKKKEMTIIAIASGIILALGTIFLYFSIGGMIKPVDNDSGMQGIWATATGFGGMCALIIESALISRGFAIYKDRELPYALVNRCEVNKVRETLLHEDLAVVAKALKVDYDLKDLVGLKIIQHDAAQKLEEYIKDFENLAENGGDEEFWDLKFRWGEFRGNDLNKSILFFKDDSPVDYD